MFWKSTTDIEKVVLEMDGFKFGVLWVCSEKFKKGSSHKTHKYHEEKTLTWN